MKILHLFSNWKWTGPAEPALNLCALLKDSHHLTLAVGAPPHEAMPNDVLNEGLKRDLAPLEGFRLRKHFAPWDNLRDCLKLRALIRKINFDLIHCHMPNDHLVAGLARMGNSIQPKIVRTFYDASGPSRGVRASLLLKHFTDGAITISKAGLNRLADGFRFSTNRAKVVLSGVDTRRFDPDRIDRRMARNKYQLGENDFVFGIVARMQKHRKFGILLKALKGAVAADPRLKLVIVGRGTHQDEVARRPVQEMGLTQHVIFTGYIQDDDFVSALAAMDAALFLVPGSDGSCRAVREKMVMGLPMIATDIPPLNEMIHSGETGILVAPTEEGLREAMLKAAGMGALDPKLLKRTRESFSLEEQRRRVEIFYEKIIHWKKPFV